MWTKYVITSLLFFFHFQNLVIQRMFSLNTMYNSAILTVLVRRTISNKNYEDHIWRHLILAA